MTLQVTLGRAATVPAGTRPRIWRAGDVAVRTAERLSFGGSSGGLALGPRAWTWEGNARIAAWMKTGGVYVPGGLCVAPNAELAFANNAGAIAATATFWMESSAGVVTGYSVTPFAVTPNTNWKSFVLQANYATGAPPTFTGAVWLDGALKGSVNPTLAAGDIPHSNRFYFGLLANTGADVDVDAATGDVAFDSWRLSNSARYALGAITPPVALFSDLGSPTIAIYDLRETAAPYFIVSNAGIARREWAIPRLSKWGDEGGSHPWTFNWNGVAAPF